MTAKETSKDILAGLFLLTGVGLFFLSLLVLGKERNLFGTVAEYNAYYADVRGLNIGAPVRLGGIAVGRVSHIDLAKELSDPRVHVTLEVQDSYTVRIRTDSIAAIETQGLLGDKYINITGMGGGSELPPNSSISTRESADLNNIVRKVEALADSAGSGIQSIAELSKTVNSAKIGETFESVHKLSASLSSSTVMSDIADIMREIKTGNGLLHNVIYSSGDGTHIQDILRSVARVANNLDKITSALSTGSGTLGALLIDSRVYDNLVEVTDDAKRSVVLRSVVRSALNESQTDPKHEKEKHE